MKMKRFLFLFALLLLAFSLSVFAGGNRSSNRAQTPEAYRWPGGAPGPAPRDLGGMVFRISDTTYNNFWATENAMTTPRGATRVAIMKGIEEDFNVKFEFIVNSIGWRLQTPGLQAAVMSGDPFAHLVVAGQFNMGPNLAADLMGDLSAIPTLNLKSDLWNQDVNRITTIGDKTFFAFGIIDHWYLAETVIFQKSLWKELNLPDPYELVRRGEWTWDRLVEFARIAPQDLTGDRRIDGPRDRWGIIGNNQTILHASFPSMGSSFWDFNPETRRFYTPAATPDGYAIADYMRNISLMPGVWYMADYAHSVRSEMFTNRRALFWIEELGAAGATLRAMDDDFGILPMPKRNAQQPAYRNWVNHGASVIGITRTNRQLEQTGIILEAMAARFAPVRELQWTEWVDPTIRSDDDLEMLNNYILPNMVYDLSNFLRDVDPVSFFLPFQTLIDYVGWGGYKTVNDFASYMEANRNAIETKANEFAFWR